MKADDSYIEPDSGDLARLLATVRQITATASARILSVYETDFAVEHKDDRSPLTEADMQAHRAIISGLRELTPGWPILSEESASVDFSERQTWQRYWLVDPLDG
ncbi:MAG: inositol monophosphatase family protein, partial [Gammaproteobacteria bacterium]